jgi:pyruvate-formate lyase-activating enzyme
MSVEQLFHVTLLSNLARGFDKYARSYSKAGIPESRFPDRFYLLRREELRVGVAKAQSLLERTRLPGDRMLAIETSAATDELFPNRQTGLGRYVERDWVAVESLHWADSQFLLTPVRIEDAYAQSLRALTPTMKSYVELRPRSVSVLPVAIGCQAACPFCYSKASASADQATLPIDVPRLRAVLCDARKRGAARAVITGGGEPGLLRFDRLVELVNECAAVLPKVVLITNGYFLEELSDADRADKLMALENAGLGVLSVSHHHHDAPANTRIMKLDAHPERIAATWTAQRERMNRLQLRWVCVLQAGGIDSLERLAAYLDWTIQHGVSEVCFKELYVSTSEESVYHDYAANEWSYRHQVPLELVLHFARDNGWSVGDRLPWGAPIFHGEWKGRAVRVAAYTEPSLFWERSHGIARSWNMMADGRCLASLEDRDSEVG